MSSWKPNTVLPVPIQRDLFFDAWFQFLFPYHGMSPKEQKVAVEYLRIYFDLKKSIPNDETLIAKILKNSDTKKEIANRTGLKYSNLELYRVRLKKAKFLLEDGSINPRLTPSISNFKDNMYTLLVAFQLIDTPKNDELQIDNTGSSEE